MTRVFYSVLLMSAAGSAAFGLWRLFSIVLKTRLNAHQHYFILKIASLLFVLPFSILQLSISKEAMGVVYILPKINGTILNAAAAYDGVNSTEAAAKLISILAFIWVCGAAALLIWRGISFALFRSTTAKFSTISNAAVTGSAEICATQLNIKKHILLRSGAVSTPMQIGFFSPVLLLPKTIPERKIFHTGSASYMPWLFCTRF